MLYDYKGCRELNVFYTIPEVYEHLELDMDKLRYQCLLHCIFPIRAPDGTLGLDIYAFQRLNNGLYEEQRRKGIHDDDPWV